MNIENKEHVVTEVYYPLGIKIPYLRRTAQPLKRSDPEFQNWLHGCTVGQLNQFWVAQMEEAKSYHNFDPKGEEGKKKPQLQLIPPVLNTELAKALAFGAAKYEPWNWRKNKVEYMTYLGAMKRHIDALLEREDVASDSGVHHMGHIAASCAIVLDAAKHGTLVDNRPPGKLNSEPVIDNGAFNGVE